MSDYIFLLPLAVALLLGVMSPGPSFLIVAQTAASKSRVDGVACSFGMGVGAAIFAVIASLGLHVVLESVPMLYIALKVIGGAYLCYLAFRIWKTAEQPMQSVEPMQTNQSEVTRSFIVGLTTQLSNPKTAFAFIGIFAALLPASIPQYAYILIAILAFVIDTVWYSLVSFLLSTQKAQRTYARYKKHICRTSGTLLGVIGLKLASNQ